MADIRDFDGGHSNTQVTARPSHKEQAEVRLNFGSAGRIAEANAIADSKLPWGVSIFGRLHGHNFHDEESAQKTADEIGGKVVFLR